MDAAAESGHAAAQDITARKFDEFVGEVDDEDMLARLDNFAIELMNRPNTQGHIIVYRTRRDRPDLFPVIKNDHPPTLQHRDPLGFDRCECF